MEVSVREKKPGEFWIFINHKGKRKSKKIGDKKTAIEVARKIEAKLVFGDVGVLNKSGSNIPTLKEYIHGWEGGLGWFNTVAQLSLKSSSRTGYRHIINNHLIPYFGSKRLDEITPRQISSYVYELFNKGLKSNTIKNIKNCFSSILQYATAQDGFIESNPARGVMIPTPEDEKPARKPAPFTWEEKNHVEDIFLNHFPERYALVVCGFRTGLRIGELIGLKWEDVDFFNRLIFVQRNITRGKITTPKSKSSRRQVRMTSQLYQVLKAQRQRIKEDKLRRGWSEVPEWIFCNENGGYLNYGNFINRVWNKGVEKSGLKKRTPHDMRHTYATLRLSKGDSLAEVSK